MEKVILLRLWILKSFAATATKGNTMGTRNLTDDDLKAITDAFYAVETHPCRFENIQPEDMKEAVKFLKHFNEIMQEGGSVVRKTIIVLGIGGLVALVGMGIMVKIKEVTGL